MGEKLPGMLLSLLIILKVFGSTEASCRISGSTAKCYHRGLTSVPQNLPTGITTLKLQYNLITTLDQSDFSRYGSLTRLELDNSRIATINSQAFHNLSDLTYLDLQDNCLSNLTADMFTGLGNLEDLRLFYNEISDIQAGTFNSTKQLRDLYLYQNKLTNLRSDMFTGLGNLEDLRLENNEISDIQAGTFESTPQLRSLTLYNNKLTNPRPDMFTGPRNLQYLDLNSNEISDVSIQAGTFNSTPQLTGLYLGVNKLTNLRSDMFTGLGNLEYLWLYSNEISDIQDGTFSSTPQLTRLDLYHNKLTNLRSDMFIGLGNLEYLSIHSNEISDIQAGTFNSTPQLETWLFLYSNKLTNLRSDMFTGLGNLEFLRLDNNEISDIQAGTFKSTPQLRTLHLQYNRLEVLKAEMFAELSSISDVNINNNPWQCDCRMLPFRQKMNGSHPFENQITCVGPSNFHGQKLQDISPEDLICEEPAIVRFGRGENSTQVEGETLHLVCEASGIPTPDITVIRPSGLNVTVESSGRVTVDVNGTITIRDITVADAGLYVCIATSFVGSKSATLSVEPKPYIVRFERSEDGLIEEGGTLYLVCEASGIPTPDITVILPSGQNVTVESGGRVTVGVDGTITITNVKPTDAGLYVCIAASSVGSTFATLVVSVQLKVATTDAITTAATTGTVPLATTDAVTTAVTTDTVTTLATTSTVTMAPKQPQPARAPSFSLPVLIGSVCGAVAGTVLVGTIILTIWCKRKTQNPPSGPTPPVIFSNASASVTIIDHDQTGQGGSQAASKSFKARNSEHMPQHPDSQGLEYEDVLLPTRKTGLSNANLREQPSEYQSLGPSQPPAEYQSLVPNRNRVPSDDLPPLPPSQNQTNRGPTGTYDTQHYYLSLKK